MPLRFSDCFRDLETRELLRDGRPTALLISEANLPITTK